MFGTWYDAHKAVDIIYSIIPSVASALQFAPCVVLIVKDLLD